MDAGRFFFMNRFSFFSPVRSISAAEAAELVGARLLRSDQAGVTIRGVAALDGAAAGDLVFAEGKQSLQSLTGLKAAAVLCDAELAPRIPDSVAVLISDAPQRAFAAIARLIYPAGASPEPITGKRGIAPTAFVDTSAMLEEGVVVEAGAVVGPGAQIGGNTVIAPNAAIGRDCRIGRNCFIGPNASVQHALLGNRVIIHSGSQLGQDGFGYVPGPDGAEKMPQLGRVVIQDGVEIGACTTIDRGALADTVIGENTKIDNLVQIAHNVRIGRNCLIASHTGISGSVTVGDNCLLGGRVGIADHIAVGSNVQLAAASGVIGDVPSGSRWGGFPAQPIRDWLRGMAALKRLGGEASKKRKNAGNV